MASQELRDKMKEYSTWAILQILSDELEHRAIHAARDSKDEKSYKSLAREAELMSDKARKHFAK